MTEQIQILPNGAAIKALREKDGWSQRDLAARAKLSQSWLCIIENETKPASQAVLNRIARALLVPLAAITHRPCARCGYDPADADHDTDHDDAGEPAAAAAERVAS